MIYTELTKAAMKLCYQAHAGQTDKTGIPYVCHPLHLAEQMDSELTIVVALLHDVVEKAEYPLEDIREFGFPDEVINALKLLTRDKNVPYLDYISQIKTNSTAKAVKIADLKHELNTTRLLFYNTENLDELEKYRAGLKLLIQDDELDQQINRWLSERTQNDEHIRDRIRGCMFGGAIGDALGGDVEFQTYDAIKEIYGENGIVTYHLHNGVAEITDDTQMSMFTACALTNWEKDRRNGVNCEKRINQYFYEAYRDWLSTQNYFIPYTKTWLEKVPQLHAIRAPGQTCLTALRDFKHRGSTAVPINRSKGCGGVMRVAPIGAYFGSKINIYLVNKIAAEAAAITHGHPLGWLPAAMLAHLISRIIYGGCQYGNDLSWVLFESWEILQETYGNSIKLIQLQRLLGKAVELSKNTRPDVDNIRELGEGWVAEEALAIAIYCVSRYGTDFDSAIIAAVNHDGDSDSTGAIVGNIIGAQIGYDAIPQKWKEHLELSDILLRLSDELYDGAGAEQA